MNPPLVSIITPLYNKADHFAPTIRSVLEQRHSNWEWIVVDDGSTDGSADLLPAGDARIRVLHQANHGPAVARNRALQHAAGEYVTFLDADDEYLPGKISRQVQALVDRPEPQWVVCACRKLEQNGKLTTKPLRDPAGRPFTGPVHYLDNAFLDWPQRGTPIDSLFVRRNSLHKIGGFDQQMRCYEVTELLARLCLHLPKVALLPEVLVQVNQVSSSAYEHARNRLHGSRRLAESYLELAEQFPQCAPELYARARYQCLHHASILSGLGASAEARRFLYRSYPGPRNLSFWRYWLRTLLPTFRSCRATG